MAELYTLTALDAVRVAGPYIFAALIFSGWTWFVIYITEVRVNRKWLRDPDNMERTVKDQLARKDVVIRSQANELKTVTNELEKCRTIIRGVQSRVIGS